MRLVVVLLASFLLLPVGAAAAPYGVVAGGGQVRTIDLATNAVIVPSPPITLGVMPTLFGVLNVAIHPNGTTVAVSVTGEIAILTLQGNGNLLDTGTRVPKVGDGVQVAFTEDGSRLLAAVPASGVMVIDTATWTSLGVIVVPGTPTIYGVVSLNGSTRAVYNDFTTKMGLVDWATLTHVQSAPIAAGSVEGLAAMPDGSRAIASSGSGDLNADSYSPATNTITAIPIGRDNLGVAVAPDGARAYFIDSGVRLVTPVNLTTTPATALPAFSVSANANSLAISPDGTRLYGCSRSGNIVSVVNLTVNPPVELTTIAMGIDGVGIAIQGGLGGSAPRLFRPFDLARVPTVTPQVQMVKQDAQGDRVRYELQWSTDPTFATFTMVNSSNGGFVNTVVPADPEPFTSNQQVSYTFTAPLTSGTTYWWRVRSNDPLGTNSYSGFSASRSFTVDTVSPGTAWLLKTTAQMQRGSMTNTTAGANQVTLANIVQDAATVPPTTDAGAWTNGIGAYVNGGTVATVTAQNSLHVYGTFNITALHPGSTITGISVLSDAWNSGTGTGRLGLELSWDGGVTWTTPQQTANLPALEATQIVGGPADLWGRAGWVETELSNANFRVRVESKRVGAAGPSWNLDFLRVTIHYSNHAPSGSYRSPPIRNSSLAVANGGLSWARIVWSKNLPAGCTAPACDVTLDVLDLAGTPIPGFSNIAYPSASITGINPATYPGIQLRANLTSASPSPELLSVSVDTVGGTPLAAGVDGFRAVWISASEVGVNWSTDGTSDALSFDVLRSDDPEGPFSPIASVVASLETDFPEYDVADQPPGEAAWYALDLHHTNGSSTRIGPIEAERQMKRESGGGCRLATDSPRAGAVVALAFALALVVSIRLRRRLC